MRFKTLALNPYLHLALLTLVVLITFNRTLGSYFIADDFGEVAYVSRIAGGDLGLLWSNFSGNYMQIPSMSVWRPWLLISLLCDFIAWGTNPFGYYLTNIVFYIGTCLALYLFIRALTSNWCQSRSALAAFTSALIFGLSPLHCEATTFVVGRVDIICAFFYLVCLNLFILGMRADHKHRKKLTILSVVSFWLAMWTKEMAIGAPFLALAIALIWGQPALQFKKSLRLSAPLLISVVVYFILRYVALGTFLGGYTQGIGDAQAASALTHWLDPDNTRRLFFPLAYSLYGSHHIFHTALTIIYVMLFALLLLRMASLSLPWRWLLFLPLWLATTLAPIYKLWGIGFELEGARFVFFATMPLASALPLFLFAPHGGKAAAKGPSERLFRPAFAALSLIGLLSLALVLGKITSRHNLEWVHAGKEVREFAQQARALAGRDHTGDTIILGIPKRRGGAEMILNGTTFKIMLGRPFMANSLPIDHLLTFDPIIFGNSNYINSQRLRDSLARPGTNLLVWSSEDRLLKGLILTAHHGSLPQLLLPTTTPPCFLHTTGHALIADVQGRAAVSNITAGDGIYFGNLNLSPMDADFVEVTLTCLEAPSDRPITLACAWKDDDPEGQYRVTKAFLSAKPAEQKVYLRLSENFRWYTQEAIRSLFLELPPKTTVSVSGVKLLPAGEICPHLSLLQSDKSARPITSLGFYPLKSGEAVGLHVVLPASLQNGQVLLEISKPNAFFENFGEGEQVQAIETTLKKDAAATVDFTVPALAKGANYQIRARSIDGAGKPLGAASDPVVVRID